MKLSGLVESENVAEYFRIPVEHVFPGILVVEELLLVGSEERVRVLLQGLVPGEELVSAHVEPDLVIRGGYGIRSFVGVREEVVRGR